MSFARRLTRPLAGRAAQAAGDPSAISDHQYAVTLGAFARLADRVLDQPDTWLDHSEVDDRQLGRLGRGWRAARTAVTGDTHPGSRAWDSLPRAERVDWWVDRIALSAGAAAAAPRFAGIVADRVPLQAGLGAATSGLAVCAVAKENGVEDPADWVPLLAKVIFDRDLDLHRDEAAQAVADAPAEGEEAPGEKDDDGAPRRVARGLWRLTRTLLALQSVFDERPRGGFLGRAVGKLPVVGVLGGWIDERGAVKASVEEAQQLIDAGATRP